MTIFAIFRSGDPAALDAALKNVFPNDHLAVAPGQWLVSATGTAKDVSDRLGISDGRVGAAIVFSMANYFGRASTEIWEWIKTKAEMTSG